MMFRDLYFPLTMSAGESLTPNAGRWIIYDQKKVRVGVLFDCHEDVAKIILQSANSLGKYVTSARKQREDVAAANLRAAAAAAATIDYGKCPFPKWMGETPRYGARWSQDELNFVKERWEAGDNVHKLIELTGRDSAGITSKLERLFGAYYHKYFDRANASKRRQAEIEQVSKRLDELLSEQLDEEGVLRPWVMC